MKIKDEFDRFYKYHFGNQELSFAPLFYNFPIGIRFEIGIGANYDETYVNNAVSRALTIFNELFDEKDIIYLVVNSFEDNPNDLANNDISTVRPLINHIQNESKFVFISTEDEGFSCTRYIIKSFVKDIQVEVLLKEIILSDISGKNSLGGCVYWFNTRNNIIYYLYDDCGLDIVSSEIVNLKPIYKKFNNWILDYDRKRIDSIFTV